MFAAIARYYDLNNRLHSLGQDQVWRKRSVQLCKVQSTDGVLDVACGTGDLTKAFADAGPACITGVDFTEEMLAIAREKSNRRRLRLSTLASSPRPTPQYISADALNLPFPGSTFDIVSIAFGIRNVIDPAAALREFHRVLRPKGRLLILEFTQPHNRILRWLNHLYTSRIMPMTATLIARDRSGAYRYLPRSVATFLNPDELADLLMACGFARPSMHPMTLGIATAYLTNKT